jgi:hypothetical protein
MCGPRKIECGVGSGFTSPAPKPRGFGLRLRAKREDTYGLNEKPATGKTKSRLLLGGTPRGSAMGVVQRELAKRLIAAEPGAGAKPG